MSDLLREEKDLLFQLHNGNEYAFEKIYEIYSPRLFGKLLKLLKSENLAKEILQDVFVKLWAHRQSVDPEKSFRSYLFKIAENSVFDFFRKVARERVLQAELIALSTVDYSVNEEMVFSEENIARLQQAIDLLPPQRQQIIRLCKLEGKSYKEVSQLLGISVSTISDHIVKGTKAIRDYFQSHPSPIMISILFLVNQ